MTDGRGETVYTKEMFEKQIEEMKEGNEKMSKSFKEGIEFHEKLIKGELVLPENYNPKPPRPTFDETFLEVARIFSKRATCPRAKVGCVIVSSENHILSTGYNGSPSGATHCIDLEGGCLLDSYSHCSRSVHAEMNAITQAAKRGTSLNGCTVYLTLKPCLTCTKALIQAGARQIFWETEYAPNEGDSQTLDNLLKECGLLSWGQVQKSRT